MKFLVEFIATIGAAAVVYLLTVSIHPALAWALAGLTGVIAGVMSAHTGRKEANDAEVD